MKEPTIRAIWNIRRGVGRRYVRINGVVMGQICIARLSAARTLKVSGEATYSCYGDIKKL